MKYLAVCKERREWGDCFVNGKWRAQRRRIASLPYFTLLLFETFHSQPDPDTASGVGNKPFKQRVLAGDVGVTSFLLLHVLVTVGKKDYLFQLSVPRGMCIFRRVQFWFGCLRPCSGRNLHGSVCAIEHSPIWRTKENYNTLSLCDHLNANLSSLLL